MAHSLGFYVDGINFPVVFGQSFQFRVFPGGTCIAQPRWMLARGILGSGQTRGVSFRPYLNSSCWWWLISSVFLIRISCHKTTHANGYYGAWPGWVVFSQCASLNTCFKNLVFIGPEVWPPEIIQNSQVVPVVKNLPATARDSRDQSSLPGVGKIPWRRKWQPLQYSCLGNPNPMDRAPWQATVHGATRSQTRLSTKRIQHWRQKVPREL